MIRRTDPMIPEKSVPLHIHFNRYANTELQTADACHEKNWHQFLSELEKQTRL